MLLRTWIRATCTRIVTEEWQVLDGFANVFGVTLVLLVDGLDVGDGEKEIEESM